MTRLCLVQGCGKEQAESYGWVLCWSHAREWCASPERTRCEGFNTELWLGAGRSLARWHVALLDWATRISSEARNSQGEGK